MDNPKTVLMFSGQGSQTFQMGKALFDTNASFRKQMRWMDEIILDICGHSLLDILYNPLNTKVTKFDRLVLTHPAIFMVEYALAQTLIESDVMPDIVLGASLGSYAAAAVAGCFDVEDALISVVRQAMIVEAEAAAGGMIAILADPQLYDDEEVLHRNCEIAALNFSGHFVVSAPQDSIDTIESFLYEKDVTFQRLPVSYAFHSRWIDSVEKNVIALHRADSYKPAKIPFACCAQIAVIENLPNDYFWGVVRKPIMFQETIKKLEAEGCYEYIDVGPSSTLAALLKFALPRDSKSRRHAIMKTVGRDTENLKSVMGLANLVKQ